jgi:hypothetical protein
MEEKENGCWVMGDGEWRPIDGNPTKLTGVEPKSLVTNRLDYEGR